MEKYLNFIKFGRVCFSRCYDFKYHSRYPAYIGLQRMQYAKSGIDLHRLTAFKKWFDENYIEGYDLDKDILVEGNRI